MDFFDSRWNVLAPSMGDLSFDQSLNSFNGTFGNQPT
jgi:hypothetical protein